MSNVLDNWSVLSESDKVKDQKLRLFMDPLSVRTTRDHARLMFHIILEYVRNYAIRRDADDWKRCLVCGLVWLDNAVAVSTRQMTLLVGKCKSSINSGFQSLGYLNAVMSTEHVVALIHLFPFLAQDHTELRQWTIREFPPMIRPYMPCLPANVLKADEPPDFVDEFTPSLFDIEEFSIDDDPEDFTDLGATFQ
jgi:hypothetical protein